ncbi:MAG: acylneuraminate cytidylyltransferase family protein [Pseudomonadota bacterium]
MSERRSALCIIPARGGSKRLPGKNIADLGGLPLIAHAIECATTAGFFDRIIVSTDDPEIANVAQAYTQVTLDHSKPELAGDKVTVIHVILDILERHQIDDDALVCLLLPTAPFRRAGDLEQAKDLMDGDTDAVIAVTDFDFPPAMGLVFPGDSPTLNPWQDNSPLVTGNTRSQDQQSVYRPNGAVLMARAAALRAHKSFYRGRMRGFVMPKLYSIDIDTAEDLALARAVQDAGLVSIGRGKH